MSTEEARRLRAVLTGAPHITKIGLRLNMDERATMEAIRAERRAAKARRRAQ